MGKSILVIGSSGQLASCIGEIAPEYSEYQIQFTAKEDLDLLASESTIISKLSAYSKPDILINCSAYTAVDLAESEEEQALQLNAIAPKVLAQFCFQNGISFIHISTDFVFPGTKNTAYTEQDRTAPIGVYGATKCAGEEAVLSANSDAVIIRTSWLYSAYGKNFCNTMLQLGRTQPELKVVNDQIGVPTSAHELAYLILTFQSELIEHGGIFHFSNTGLASWFEFTQAIFEYSNITTPVLAIPSSQFPTPAKRPHFSVLDTRKISEVCNYSIPYWKDSLKKVLKKLQDA